MKHKLEADFWAKRTRNAFRQTSKPFGREITDIDRSMIDFRGFLFRFSSDGSMHVVVDVSY